MPSTLKLPTAADYLQAYRDSLNGQRGALLDVREGSGFEIPGGMSALLWARQARRDRDLFRQCYTDTATGDDLDRQIERKYGVTRILATFGSGLAYLSRASSNGPGTIYEGSRIEITHPGTNLPPTQYKVSADTNVDAAALNITIPIQAIREGTGVAVSTSSNLRVADILFDAWTIQSLVCSDGSEKEKDDAYRTRAKATALDVRVGYETAIIQACEDAGADNAVLLGAGSFGPSQDYGLNYLYVGDASFSTSDALKKACSIAIDKVRVAGCDTQVLGMQQAGVSITATIYLYDDPGGFNIPSLKQIIVAKLLDEFKSSAWWIFRVDSLVGAVQSVSNAIQSVALSTNPGEPSVTFPSVLTRYVPSSINLTFAKGT